MASRTATMALAPFDGSPPPYASTHYRLNGGPVTNYAGPFGVADEGNHTLQYWSVDANGTTEPLREARVRVDLTPPTGRFVNPSKGNAHTANESVGNPAQWTLATGPVDVIVEAADATAGVERVTILLDGETLGNATLETDGNYHYTWDSTDTWTGNHLLAFVVEDKAGRTTTGEMVVYVTAGRSVVTPGD